MTTVLVILGIIFVMILVIIAAALSLFSRIGIGGVIAMALASKCADNSKKGKKK